MPAATFCPETFEEFEPEGRFDAIFSSNAFHWLDPAVGYEKAADVADAIVLLWNTPFIADPDLHRRMEEEVMHPHGSTFPIEWLRLTIDPGVDNPTTDTTFGPFSWERIQP